VQLSYSQTPLKVGKDLQLIELPLRQIQILGRHRIKSFNSQIGCVHLGFGELVVLVSWNDCDDHSEGHKYL